MCVSQQDGVYLWVQSQVVFNADLFKLEHTVARGKNLWTLNDSAPFHCVLNQPLLFMRQEWGRGCQALHESLIFSHLPLLSCHRWPIICEISCGRMEKSVVEKWTYRMRTGKTTIHIQGEQRPRSDYCDSRMQKEWIEQLGAVWWCLNICHSNGTHLHFAFHFISCLGWV